MSLNGSFRIEITAITDYFYTAALFINDHIVKSYGPDYLRETLEQVHKDVNFVLRHEELLDKSYD